MKFTASIIILIFSLLFVACSNPENLQVTQPNSTPVLEMSAEMVGLWGVQGELLDFRLYENGLVEFDEIDNNRKTPQKTIYKTEELKVRKQIYISESEVGEIINLLKSDEFSKLENTYSAKRAGTDIAINNTIRFQSGTQEKTIKILGHIENLSNPNPDNFPDFPAVLSKLYRQIGEIRRQALKK